MERNIRNIVDHWIWDHMVVSIRRVTIAKWHGVVNHSNWMSEGEDFVVGKQKLCDAGHHCVL